MTIFLEQKIIYPDSDGKPMADNTKQFRCSIALRARQKARFSCIKVSGCENVLTLIRSAIF